MDGAAGKSSYNGEVFQLFSPVESHSAIYFPHMSSTRASLDFAKGHSRSASHGSVGSSSLVSPSYTGSQNAAGRPSALKKGHKRALSHGHILDSNELLLNRHVRTPSKTDFILPEGHRDSESSVFEKYRAAVGGAAGSAAQTGHSRQASRTDSVYTLRNNSAGTPPLWKRYLCFFRAKKRPKEEARLRTIVPNHTLPPKSSKHLKSAGRIDNKICTTKYTLLSFLPKNLLEQFHRFANLYFIFIVLLNWFPPINAFGKEIAVLPVLFVLGVTAMKDLFEDRRRHRSDKRINNSVCRVYRDREIGYMDILWKDVRPGDLVRIANNNVIPADILVLHCSDPNGLCFIDTCNLDGESNLKQRQVPHCFVRKHRSFQADLFRSSVEAEPPTTKIYRFNGALVHPSGTRNPVGTENLLLRECVLKNTDFVEGIVVYAGHETKAMLNNNGPRYKRSFLEKQVNNDIMWCVVILLVLCCTGAVGNSIWRSSFTIPIAYIPFLPYDDFSGLYKFFVVGTFIIILQVMIPLSLYVTIELVKLLQVYHIHNNDKLYDPATNKRVECRALNITEELGQVQYIFSDKTGTLTENKMLFRRCTIAGTDYNHPAPAMDVSSLEQQRKPVDGPGSISYNPKLAELNNAYNNGVRFFNRDDRRFNLSLSSSPLSRQQYADAKYVQDFMLVLALCNTVVISVHSPPNDLKTTTTGSAEDGGANSMDADGDTGARHHLANANDSSGDDQYDSEFINEAEEEELDAAVVRPRSTPSAGTKYGQKWLIRKNNLFRHFVTVRQPNGNNSSVTGSGDRSIRSNDDNSTVATDPDSSPRFHPYSSLQQRLSTLDIFNASAFRTRFFPKRRGSSLFRNSGAGAGAGGEKFHGGVAGIVGVTGEFSGHIEKPLYEAESPDELALVETAYLYNYRLVGRSISSATLVTPENRIMIFDVLKLLPFDSVRKCMSVIVRHPVTNEIIVFCKGADSTILPLLINAGYHDDSRQIILNRTRQHLNMYASQGLRVLVMARRVLSEKEFDDWIRRYKEAELSVGDREKKIQKCYSEIERNFELLGATGIEDRLQEGVPETIASLRAAGIVVWVLTGDKKETAINVAYSSQLFNPQMEIIRISARSKDSAQNSILYHLKEIENCSNSPLSVSDHRHSIPGTSGVVGAAAADNRRASASARNTKQPVLLSLFSVLQRNGNKLLCLASEEAAAAAAAAANNFNGGRGIGNVNKQRALVIDGKTLTFILDRRSDLQEPFLRLTRYCTSVLCCRATPLQKAYIVRIVKEKLRMRTLAIGDGANDVSMIQAADVGIGISGQEGMQAVMASDFSMPRFRFLERFLLVHGHWCYDRLANMVLYFFYKNAIFVFLIFWYQLFCGFSGAVMIDEMYLMLYNLFFTSLPPLVIGVYDRDAPEELLMSHPKLYNKGRLGLAYQQPYSFWLSILDALYQSSIIFFFAYSVYDFSEIGIWEFGMTIVTSCMVTMLLQGCLMTRSWSIVLLLSSIISLGSFFLFTLFYNSVCMQCHGLISNVWVLDTTLYTVTYWLVVVISTTCALLPRIVFSAVKKSLMPDDISRLLARHQSRQLVSQRKENFLVSWSRCASSMLYRSRESKANKQGKSHTLTSVE